MLLGSALNEGFFGQDSYAGGTRRTSSSPGSRRQGVAVGPLRYLLLSVRYGSLGYPSDHPERRERLVGFEIGLDIKAILNDVGVLRDTWRAIPSTAPERLTYLSLTSTPFPARVSCTPVPVPVSCITTPF